MTAELAVGDAAELGEAGEAPTYAVAEVRGVEAFRELESDWRRLAAGTENPFLAWEWVDTWARHFWDQSLLTLVVSTAGTVVGILPFSVETAHQVSGRSTRRLRLFGPRPFEHMSELREPLLDPRYSAGALDAALCHVRAGSAVDWIELCGYESRGAIDAAAAGHDFDAHAEGVSMLVMPLATSWPEQLGRLNKKFRKVLRNLRNLAERSEIQVKFRCYSGADVAPWVPVVLDLHRQRARARRGPRHLDYFRSPRVRAFILEAAPRMAEAGRLSISTLEFNGQVVAARFNLETASSLYLYFSGFDVSWWRHGPMTLLVMHSVEDAMRRGLGSINFSPGIDRAKLRWPCELREVRHLSLVSPRAGARLGYALARQRTATLRLLRDVFVAAGVPPVHLRLHADSAGW